MNICSQCLTRNDNATRIKGADVNMLDDEGYTSLIRAAENGHVTCVNGLITSGADVNTTGSYGYSALLMACVKDECECAETLIHAGADVNVRTDSGRSALYGAVIHRNIRIITLLLKSGIHVNQYDVEGQNALEGHVKRWYPYKNETSNKRRISTLLHVAGEKIGPNYKKPEHLITSVHDPSLKHCCRETIRNYLIDVNPHLNLFRSVYQLGIPSMLAKFLLYDTSLE